MNTKVTEFLKKQWSEWRGIILFFTFIFLPLRSSVADWNWVPTGSMNPTILEGDMVYVNKLAYDIRAPLTLHSLKQLADPERGDICVLFSPEDKTRMVKRVVGLPGDTVEMRANILSINSSPVDYSELEETVYSGMSETLKRNAFFAKEQLGEKPHAVMSIKGKMAIRDMEAFQVPAGKYFVMGDNRDNSKDSRYFGFVERNRIIGKATSVIVSFNKLDKLQPRVGRFFTSLD